ncbi:xylulokinase [Ruminococcaceae bacterium YRB3002]|nr:xylulokinase [Ruminococcaceae bacterium YRB3002]
MNYIGIDLGTSGVKLLLMTGDGKILNKVTEEYGISFPHPGWSEQDPRDWYDHTIIAMKKLISGIDPSSIGGIGVGGQMHGLVLLDEHDEVIRPAILWNDGRTTEETSYLNNDIGTSRLAELTGNIAFAGFTAPKILWVYRNEPSNFARIRKIMLPKDYIVYRLTGAFTTDFSDASGMLLLDVRNRRWSREMLEICHISESMLPLLRESSAPIGTVLPSVASSLGLTGSVTVVAGAGDNAAAAIGTGTVGPGRCNISLGTSGTIFITSGGYVQLSNNALHFFAHADGRYHIMGCMLSAASCNKWWMDGILGDHDYAAAQRPVTDDALGTNPVYFLPYLMGERSPHNDPSVRAMFTGMSMDTTRTQMTQAVLEGVAYGMRDCLEVARSMGINISESCICGGGGKSELWRRIMANVLNVRIKTLKNDEGPALGGAILAAVGSGAYSDVISAADRIVEFDSVIEPDPEIASRYDRGYQVYRELYPRIKM